MKIRQPKDNSHLSIRQTLNRVQEDTASEVAAVAEDSCKVKVDQSDNSCAYLLSKLVGGTNINLVQQDPGGDDSLRIDATGAAADVWVKVTGADTTADFLDNKVVPGDGLIRTIVNPGLNEQYQLDVVANGDGSIQINANDVQVGVLATDGQHGNRGGGALHALVVGGGAHGFMDEADKTKLDGVAPSATNTPLSGANPVQIDAGDTAVPGVGTNASRDDHQHPVNTAVAGTIQDIALAASAGVSQEIPRGDHVHAHGNQPTGPALLHALAVSGGNPGFMSGADKAKLDGCRISGYGQIYLAHPSAVPVLAVVGAPVYTLVNIFDSVSTFLNTAPQLGPTYSIQANLAGLWKLSFSMSFLSSVAQEIDIQFRKLGGPALTGCAIRQYNSAVPANESSVACTFLETLAFGDQIQVEIAGINLPANLSIRDAAFFMEFMG